MLAAIHCVAALAKNCIKVTISVTWRRFFIANSVGS